MDSTLLQEKEMAALGLTTHVSALKKAGAKPLLMALVLFAWLIVGGGAMVKFIYRDIPLEDDDAA